MSTILNVDDTEAQRYATSRILRHAGFDVVEADTGQKALERILQRPDLVILDVNLPDMTGYEVCRRIRLDELSARVPVLQLSATLVSTQAKVAGLEGGADAYLVQPVEPEELLATVRALLRVRKSEETLWQSEQQYRLFFEANPLACWIFDGATGSILAVNEAAVHMYGYSRPEFISMTVGDISRNGAGTSVAMEDPMSCVHQALKVQKHRTKNGSLLDVEVLWSPLQIAGKKARLAIVQDITGKREREQAQREEEVRRLLLHRVLQAQEEERRRVARELHDEAGQLMTSLLVGLRSIDDAKGLTQVKQHAKRLRKITSDTITELSRMARGLHSGILEDLGLEEALRKVVDDYAAAHKVQVKFDFGKPDFATQENSFQLGVFRIVQEALTNIARHSRAKGVTIKFAWNKAELILSIEDDGQGFETADVTRHPSRHLGIEVMRQRATMLGGTLEIDSRLERGTRILVKVPLREYLRIQA